MRKIDEALLALGLFWLLAALAGPVLGQGAVSPPSGFSLSAMIWGFAASTGLGLIYRLIPPMRASKASKPQFWAHAAGSALLSASPLIADSGYAADIASFGTVVMAASAILFAVSFAQGRTLRA